MAELHALVVKNADGTIKRIVRSYESHSRADQDMKLMESMDMPEGDYCDIIELEHIEN